MIMKLSFFKRTAAMLLLPVGVWTVSPGSGYAQTPTTYTTQTEIKPVIKADSTDTPKTTESTNYTQSLGDTSPLSSPLTGEVKSPSSGSTRTDGVENLRVTVSGTTAQMTYNGKQYKGSYDPARQEAVFMAALSKSQKMYLNEQSYAVKLSAAGIEALTEITKYKSGDVQKNRYEFNASGQFVSQSWSYNGSGQQSSGSTAYTFVSIAGKQQIETQASSSSWSSTRDGVSYSSSSMYKTAYGYEVINGIAYVSSTRSKGESVSTDANGMPVESFYESSNFTRRNAQGVVMDSVWANLQQGAQGEFSSAGYSRSEGTVRESAYAQGAEGSFLFQAVQSASDFEVILGYADLVNRQHYADTSLAWSAYLYSTERVKNQDGEFLPRKITYADGRTAIVADPKADPAALENQILFKNGQQTDIEGVSYTVSFGPAYAYPESGQYYASGGNTGVRADKGAEFLGYGIVLTPVYGLMDASGAFYQQSLVFDYPAEKTAAIGGVNYDIRISADGIVNFSKIETQENPALKALAEIKALRGELAELEAKLSEAMAAKQGSEDKFKELNEILNGKVTGMLWMDPAGMPEEMAFFRQVMMTLDLISEELQKTLESGDRALIDAAVKRFTDYRDSGDPSMALKQLEEMIKAAEERRLSLPSLIQETENLIRERSAARKAAVQKTLASFSDLMTVHGSSEARDEFAEHVWPEYMSYGDVLLPWKHLTWVESETYRVTVAGMDLKLEFRNGEMTPLMGSFQPLKAAMKEYPGKEVKMLRLPEVLSIFGGYSVVRNGFAHFFSVSQNGEAADFVLYETDYPGSAESQPRKTSVFSIYDVTPAMLSLADVNQDQILDGTDADLMIQATVTENSWGGSAGKMPDLNADGIVNRADALIVLGIVMSGDEAAERLRLTSYVESVLKAQESFLRALPGIWQEVGSIQPEISREELERMAGGEADAEGRYVLTLHDYFTLMKTASEAIALLNPDLIFERHPQFFDADGNLNGDLVRVIEEAGLAALPAVAVFERVDTRIALSDLRLLAETMSAELGEDPAAVFDAKLAESEIAKVTVMESLDAVNATIRSYLEMIRKDQTDEAVIGAFVRVLITGGLDFDGDGRLGEGDQVRIQEVYSLVIEKGVPLSEEFKALLDTNPDGVIDFADAQVLEVRLTEAGNRIGQASALAKSLTGFPDLNADGRIGSGDLDFAVSGYQAAFEVLPYLAAEISEVLDTNGDGLLTQDDSDIIAAKIEKAIEDSSIPEFKGFEVSAATGENGARDLKAAVAADGSALVVYQGQQIKAFFDKASLSIRFEIPRGPYDSYLSFKAGTIFFLGAEEGYAMRSFELRQSYSGGGVNTTQHVFNAEGMLASVAWEYNSAGYSSRSVREFLEYQSFSNGEFRPVSVRSSSKSVYSGGGYSSESEEKYAYQEINGSIFQTSSQFHSVNRQDSGDGMVLETVNDSKYFSGYSEDGQLLNQASVYRTMAGGQSSVSAWYQLSDSAAMTRTYANTQSDDAEIFDQVNGLEGIPVIDAAADVKTVQFYPDASLNWPMKYSLEYSHENVESQRVWQARRVDFYDASGRAVSRIVVDPADPMNPNNPLIQNWQSLTAGGIQYSVSFGPAYEHGGFANGMYADGSYGKSVYLGYGLTFSAWIVDADGNGKQVTILAADYPASDQVTFPDGKTYRIQLDEKGIISLI